MTLRHVVAIGIASTLGAVILMTLLPGIALADNCSSLSDCWGTAGGAASAAAGAAFGAIGGLFGGGGSGGNGGDGGDGGGGGDDDGLPENEDLPDPRPC
jgi:hypothetical protein